MESAASTGCVPGVIAVHVFPGRDGGYFVRLVASNGETLSISESFRTKWNAKRHAKRFFPQLPIKELER